MEGYILDETCGHKVVVSSCPLRDIPLNKQGISTPVLFNRNKTMNVLIIISFCLRIE